jgi:ubiquitin-protein ligase
MLTSSGPPDSTYSGGTFLLYVEMGNGYPMSPPEARFITPIYHPNINRHGRICHSILDRNWTLDTSTKDVIDTIYSLLLVPEFSDPINTVVTLNYHWNEVQFKEEAQLHIEKHASKSRADWRSEIVG